MMVDILSVNSQDAISHSNISTLQF